MLRRAATLAVGLVVCLPIWVYFALVLGAARARLWLCGRVPAAPPSGPGVGGASAADEPAVPDLAVEHSTLDVGGGITLHAARAGAPSGPLALLLHGFPEFWFSWRHVMVALAADGYDVVAVDMRGYGLSSKPAGVSSYSIDRLAADALAVPRALARANDTIAVLVGHDWGGNVAIHAAALGGLASVERLVAIAIPHPRAFAANFTWAQARKSWYMALFQAPLLGEAWLTRGGCAGVAALVTARRGPKLPREADMYAAAFGRAGVATGAINYYRAAARALFAHPAHPARAAGRAARHLAQPTLMLHGDRDFALGAELWGGTARWVPRARVVLLPGVGHWPQLEAPDAVVAAMREFLLGGGGEGASS